MPSALCATSIPSDSLGGDSIVLPSAIVRHRVGGVSLGTVSGYDLSRAAWENRGAVTLAEALRRLPATTVRDYGGAGGLKTVSVRGMGSQHTVVTVDGIPVSDAQGGAIDLRRFDLEHSAGICLTLGDSPDLLSAPRSLGAATLNVRSAAPGEMSRKRVRLRLGSFGTIAPSVDLGGKFDSRTAWQAAAEAFSARNDYPYVVPNGETIMHLSRRHSEMTAASATLSATRDTGTPRGSGNLRFGVQYQGDWRNLPGQVILYREDNAEFLATHHATAQTQWQQEAGQWQMAAAAKFALDHNHYTDTDGKYPGGQLHQHYRLVQGYAMAGIARRVGKAEVAYAADASIEGLASNLATANDIVRRGLVQTLSLRYKPRGGAMLTARLTGHLYGERADASTRNFGRLTPSVSASWRVLPPASPTTLVLRAGYSSHFRLPTFAEAYHYHLGSQNLRPERVQQGGGGLTLGYSPAAADKAAALTALSLSIDAYIGSIKDRIVSIPYTLNVWRTLNMGLTHHHGLDIAADATLALGHRHRLSLAATYAWQVATDRTQRTSASYGKQIAYLPHHSGSLALAWHAPWLTTVVSMTTSGRRWATNEHIATTDLPPYAEVSLSLRRDFDFGKGRRLDLRLECLNLADHRYEIIRRYPMPGRNVLVTACFAWD